MATNRKKIVSMRQVEVLLEFLENHRHLAIGRLRSKEGRALSQRLWAECANLLNAEADGISRSPKEWQKWYTDYKSRILTQQRQIRQNIGGTGGGAGVPVIPLGAIEERLCSLIKGNTPVVGRDGTPPEEVRINPIHEIEEVVAEHFGGDNNIEIVKEDTSNVDENDAVADLIEEIEVRPRHSRRPTRRLREEEVPQTENNSALEESRRMLIRMETLRCESTQLLAESVKQLAASLVQNAEATKELAQSMRLEKISIAVLAECLNIFGTGEESSLKMYYRCEGSPLLLVIQPQSVQNVMTDCEISTQTADSVLELRDEDSAEVAKLVLKAPAFLGLLADLERSCDIIQINLSPEHPNVSIVTYGMQDRSCIEVPKSSDMVQSFACEAPVTLKYQLHHIRLIMKALAISTKVVLRCSANGLLLLQLKLEKEDQRQMFSEFYIVPLLDD